MKKTGEHGAEFLSYNAVTGVWKLALKNFGHLSDHSDSIGIRSFLDVNLLASMFFITWFCRRSCLGVFNELACIFFIAWF